MADLRPFPALRYRLEAVGDLAELLSPPFDVISRQQQMDLYRRSPFNIVRLEYGEQRPGDSGDDNRYTRAATTLAEWLESGVLFKDDAPSFYVYRHAFPHQGRHLERRALFARVRLEDWSSGTVRPHEHTMAQPKEDRLELLRRCRVNVSPVLSVYRDPEGVIGAILDDVGTREPLIDATDAGEQRHRLTAFTESRAIEAISAHFHDWPLYIADGHHRYETALAYRDERRSAAPAWSGEEGENFVLMALTAAEDPGLVVRPIHRLANPPSLPADLTERLERFFRVEAIPMNGEDAVHIASLLADRAGAGTAAFALLGPGPGRLHLLTLERRDEAQRFLPASASAAWRSLDVATLHYVVFGEVLGIDPEAREEEGIVTYCHEVEDVLRAVESGRFRLGVLLNPTPVEQILAVADAGERMPHKSTSFHPKLATGLVLNALD